MARRTTTPARKSSARQSAKAAAPGADKPPAGRRTATRTKARAKGSRSARPRAAGRRPASLMDALRRLRLPGSPAQRAWAGGFALLVLAALVFLGQLAGHREHLAAGLLERLHVALGWGAYAVPLALAAVGGALLARGLGVRFAVPWARLGGGVVVLGVALGLTERWGSLPATGEGLARGGGAAGNWLDATLTGALGGAGAAVVLLAVGLVGASLTLGLTLSEVVAALGRLAARLRATWDGLRARRPAPSMPPLPLFEQAPDLAAPPPAPAEAPPAPPKRPRPAEAQGAQAAQDASSAPAARPAKAPKPAPVPPSAAPVEDLPAWRPEPGPWDVPRPADVLAAHRDGQVNVAELRARSRLIEHTLNALGVPVSVVEVNPGPAVTQFGLEPGYIERKDRQGRSTRSKVKVSRIQGLSNDLALALAASPIRIEAPVPGKSVVGVEVPNSEPALVGLRGVLESDEYRAQRSPLAVALGRDVSGEAVVADLGALPHLLIAGSTGSGKSVCVNALIAALLCRNSPEVLRLLMVDPKRVELSGYDGIPHLLAPVVVDMSRVVGVLQWLLREMDRRYERLAEAGVRHIGGYNEAAARRSEPTMPYIVCLIDELADLMMVSSEEVERALCRLAQMARATGIHLVVATQRPSVDVVTGLIKANFPARLAFAVTSQTDSRVILDTPGAEKLLGRGDALFMAPDAAKLARVQGCWVSDEELRTIVGHWRAQAKAVPAGASLPEGPLVQQPLWGDDDGHAEEAEDALLEEAIAIVTSQGRASTSFLQRALGIGYTRASRLIEALEARGIVGPQPEGNRPREVLVDREGAPLAGAGAPEAGD
jgi:S-DNA-T family DNA segregation ATPase FtsK/SpoIIIE